MDLSSPLDRRSVLVQSLVAAGLLGAHAGEPMAASALEIENVTRCPTSGSSDA